MRWGKKGSATFRSGSKRPSAASFCRSRSSFSRRSPRPTWRSSSMLSPRFPFFFQKSTLTKAMTRSPCLRSSGIFVRELDQMVNPMVDSSVRSLSFPKIPEPRTSHWVISPSTQTNPKRSRYDLSLLVSSAIGHGFSGVDAISLIKLKGSRKRRLVTVSSPRLER